MEIKIKDKKKAKTQLQSQKDKALKEKTNQDYANLFANFENKYENVRIKTAYYYVAVAEISLLADNIINTPFFCFKTSGIKEKLTNHAKLIMDNIIKTLQKLIKKNINFIYAYMKKLIENLGKPPENE